MNGWMDDVCFKMVMLFHLTLLEIATFQRGKIKDEASHLITAAGAKRRNEHQRVTQSQKLPAQFISDKIDNEKCAHFSPMLQRSSVNEQRKPGWEETNVAPGLGGAEAGDQYLNFAKKKPSPSTREQLCSAVDQTTTIVNSSLKFILAVSHFLSFSP